MKQVSGAIAALLLGVQVAISTPVHPRLNTNGIAQRATDNTPEVTTSDIFLGVYIVEFADENESPSNFYASLAANGVHAEHRRDLSCRFFKGVSFEVKSSGANSTTTDHSSILEEMQAVPQVRNIWPSRIISRSRPVNATVPSQQSRVKRQTQQMDSFSPHVMTQVDKLHAEGVTGKGFRIAIVDSGIDYTHPALGGCFGPGCLVEIGYDFTGDNYKPGLTPLQPDNDPMDNCVGHGTHVAGIIAAQLEGNKYGFTGSAPGVKLGAYRMWGCPAQSTTEVEVAAFARAVEDGADIISYSNGDESGWTEDARSVIISRIVDSGIPVIVSEGNSGGEGLFAASTPATGASVTGTGAVANTLFPALLQQGSYKASANSTGNDTTKFSFLMGTPAFAADTTLPLWSAADACKPLPDDTPDLSGRIVLVESVDSKATRCYPPDQGANIAAKGGRFMIYYEKTNLTMRDDPFVYADGIEGVVRAVPYQAEHWLSLLSQGATVTVTIPANASADHLEELENHVTGGYVSGPLSSWGPSWELNMTPTIVSPGENILGTWPTAMGSYRVLTGTSMSTPLVAGIYAMLGEVYGKLDPKRLRRILTHTSKPLAWHDGKVAHPDILAPVPQQGAGMIQAWDAAHTTLELDIDSIMLNDTEHFVGTHTFSISNTGSTDQVLKMGHQKAVTMYTMRPNSPTLQPGGFPNSIVTSYASVSFSSDSITVPAGQYAKVTVTLTPPTGLNATLLPVYSGFITVGEKLVLPYMGVAGSMRATPILTPVTIYLASGYGPAPANKTYTIPRPDPANPPATDKGDDMAMPNVYIHPVIGTRLVHVDVLQGKEVLGPLAGWPQRFVGRIEKRAWFNGLLASGRVLEQGVYRVRVKALRLFGDEGREGNWDVVETVEFGVRYS
ncbi:subtilisin Carlsberg [Pyrenophora seminiperda CCB06]|uniref:Subtilisin Carlsberg n=1 Tax=Pyrenophora seminiperda CCB06 TaxID=1302712 RepID=A0A3M7MBI8_9PLEO|nr:subtilisin Carlsberg [Pyrenophora seminiperda CCB06]